MARPEPAHPGPRAPSAVGHKSAEHHAASAKVSTWAAARGFNAWDLSCVVACLEILNKESVFVCAALPPIERARGRRYTVDHGHGTSGNLYSEVNRDLRALGKAAPIARDVFR